MTEMNYNREIRPEILAGLQQDAKAALTEIIEKGRLKAGDLFVIGCSSSEMLGSRIGTDSSMQAAEAVFATVYPLLQEHGIALAVQCCEHLNRALVTERSTAEKYGLTEVNVLPQPKAGGSFATVAYREFKDPVMVEDLHAQADAGMDIGGTLIGMHIRPVVVPLKISVRKIGEAVLICARRRPKFVGGSRAVYNQDLL